MVAISSDLEAPTGDYVLNAYGLFDVTVAGLARFQVAFSPNDHGGAGQRIPMTLRMDWVGASLSGALLDVQTGYPLDVATGPHTELLSGSYTVTVEDCWEMVDIADGTSIAATNPDLCDTLPAFRSITAQMYVKATRTITATCTYAGVTVGNSCTAAADFALETSTRSDLLAQSGEVNAFIEVDVFTAGLSETTPGGSHADTYHTATWGATVRADATGGIPTHNTGISYVLAELLQYDWAIQVNAIDVPYPDALTALVVVGVDPFGTPITQTVPLTGGAGSLSIEQKSWLVGATFDGSSVVTDSGVTIWPVSYTLTSASLSAAGEDTHLSTAGCMAGWIWDALSVSKASSIDVWTGTQTATGGAGTITVLASAFDSRLLGSSWVGASFGGFRDLDVYLTGDAAGLPATIHLGSKSWAVTVGTTGHVRIDLDSPTSAHSDIDATNSPYPLTGSGPYTAADGWGSGVRNTPSIVIDGLAAGHTYMLTKATLVETDHTNLTCLDSFRAWVLATTNTVAGVTSDTYYRQSHVADTDGQQSLWQTDLVWIQTSGGSTGNTISAIDIATFVANLNGSGGAYPTDGWSATDLQPDDSSANLFNGYINSHRESTLVRGSGLSYDGSAYQAGIRKPLGTLPAQILYHGIQLYPGCGDLWNWSGGASGVPTKLRARVVLRGAAWGIALDGSGASLAGVGVTVKDHTSHLSYGVATSDTIGEFLSGLSYVPGLKSADVAANYSPTPLIESGVTFNTRQRLRFAFRPDAISNISALAIDAPRQWLHVGRDKQVWSYHLADYSMAFHSSDYPIDTWLDMQTDARWGVLLLVGHITSGNLVKVYQSTDGGETGTEVVSVTANTAVIERDSERSYQVFFYGDASDNVYYRRSSDGGQTFDSAQPSNYLGVQLVGKLLSITQDPRSLGLMLLTVVISGSTSVLASTDFGETWALALS